MDGTCYQVRTISSQGCVLETEDRENAEGEMA